MPQIQLNVSKSKFKLLYDFLNTLDYVEIETLDLTNENFDKDDCSTAYELSSERNKNRLDESIKKIEENQVFKKDLIEELRSFELYKY